MNRTCIAFCIMSAWLAAPMAAENPSELSHRIDEIRRETKLFKLETQQLLILYVQRHLSACQQESNRVQQRWRDLEESEKKIHARIAVVEKLRRERELTPFEAREAAEDDDSGLLAPASEKARILDEKRQLAVYKAFLENEINAEQHRLMRLQASIAELENELAPSRNGAAVTAR